MYLSGKTIRLNRLFNPSDGKAVCVAADHGWMSDPTENVYKLKSIIADVVKGGGDGILMSFGSAMRLGHLLHGKNTPALILRADWMNLPRLGGANVKNILPVTKFQKRAASRAKDALIMGASAITIYYFIGYSDEFEALNLEQAAVFAKECRKVGLPLIIEPMAVGSNATGVNIADILISSARIAVELGADALKIPYTGDVVTFKKLVDAAKVPVLVLGGAKSDVPRDALELVDEALRAGAHGTVFGRNVTKAKDPAKMVSDLVQLVHHGKSLNEIFNTKPEGKLQLKAISKNCIGCELCLIACSKFHNKDYGYINVRLKLSSTVDNFLIPKHKVGVCTLCNLCVTKCKTGALYNDENGYLKFEKSLCNNCNECIDCCPYKLLFFDNDNLIYCDMCGGEPQCALWCRNDAIVIQTKKSEVSK